MRSCISSTPIGREETQALVEKFKALIEQNGTVDEMEEMGKRKLPMRSITCPRGTMFW
jgi:ribosomal protein S6